jgi:hypothetical protein
MLKTILTYLIIIFLVVSCHKTTTEPNPVDNRDILEKIESIEGIDVTEITPQNGYARQFEIDIIQPVDHNNPAGQTFLQRAYLSHINETAPVVLATSGYSARPTYLSELAEAMTVNQLQVAHRFMPGAEPSFLDWEYLTIEQSAADLHRIVDLFKQIYTGTWISYGGSKNGMTALFFRRFYPNDVEATIALYAPLPQGIDDPRFDHFLMNVVGSEEDREKIKRYQRASLAKRDSILPLIRNFMDNSNLTYSLGEDVILEFEICEFPFAFWQLSNGDCSVIPDSGASAEELYTFLEDQGGFVLYSEEYIKVFEPVYYQAYTEFGWYRLINDHLHDLLVTVPNPSYSFFAPKNVPLIFKPYVMQDIISWLQTEGNNIIYIYGSQDPWTAAAIELTGQTNSIKIVQQGANHYLRIDDLDEKDLVYSTIEQWTGIKINNSAIGKRIPMRIEKHRSRLFFDYY